MMMFWLLCLMIGVVACVPLEKAGTGSWPQAGDNANWMTWKSPAVGGGSYEGSMMYGQPDSSSVQKGPAQDIVVNAGSHKLPQNSGHWYPNAAAPADNYKGPEKHYYGGYDSAYAPGGAAAGSQHYAASTYAVAAPADNYKGPEKHYYGGYDSVYAPGGAAAGSQHYAASVYAVAAPADNYKDSDSKYAQGETVETQDGDPISEAEALAIYYTNLSDKEALNREPVFSDVSGLEPVYTFSSRSKYNRGRSVFSQTRYTPGEPAPIFPMSQSKNRHPSKAGY